MLELTSSIYELPPLLHAYLLLQILLQILLLKHFTLFPAYLKELCVQFLASNALKALLLAD
jgi:hypothetical protein